MQRIRDNKATQGAGGRGGNGGGGERQAKPQQGPRQGNGGGNGGRPAQGRGGNGNGAVPGNVQGRGQQPRRHPVDDAQPRMGAHQPASPFVQRDPNPVRHSDGQPDPLRTSVDMMGGRGRRGGNGGGRGFGGGGGGRGNGARNWGR